MGYTRTMALLLGYIQISWMTMSLWSRVQMHILLMGGILMQVQQLMVFQMPVMWKEFQENGFPPIFLISVI